MRSTRLLLALALTATTLGGAVSASSATAPLAVSQRPSMIFFSSAWPSSNTLLAASPTTSSFRMAG